MEDTYWKFSELPPASQRIFSWFSNIRTCPRRFLGSKVGAGIGAVFAVRELTPATRFSVVICDCGSRADGEEEGPSCADGTT